MLRGAFMALPVVKPPSIMRDILSQLCLLALQSPAPERPPPWAHHADVDFIFMLMAADCARKRAWFRRRRQRQKPMVSRRKMNPHSAKITISVRGISLFGFNFM